MTKGGRRRNRGGAPTSEGGDNPSAQQQQQSSESNSHRNLPVIEDERDSSDKVQPIPDDAGFVDMSSTADTFSTLSVGSAPAAQARSTRQAGGDIRPEPVYRGPVVMPPKPAKPGTVTRQGTGPITLLTNMFKLQLDPNIVMWQYYLNIWRGQGKHIKTLSKGGGDDYNRYIKREKCWDVFQALLKEHSAIFNPNKITFVYDRCRSLMSNMKIPGIECGKKPKEYKVSIWDNDIEGREEWNVEVAMTEAEGVVVSDISSLNVPNLAERNMEPKRILEIMTSQVLFKQWAEGGSVVVTGQKAYDYNTVKQLPSDCGFKFTMQGFQKSVKSISSGPRGAPEVAMSIDFKFAAFFTQGPMEKFLQAEFPRLNLNEGLSDRQTRTLQEAHRYIKEIVFKTTHVKGKSFTCRGFNMSRSVKDTTFEHDGKPITLVKYYQTKYGVTLKYPNMPALRDERGSAYPVEVCVVAPNQRVPIMKQNRKQMQSMIKDAAVLPSRRMEIVMQQLKENNLAHNQILSSLGVQLLDSCMSVAGRLLPLPTIKMQRSVVVPNSGEFRIRDGGKFLVGSGASVVAVLVPAHYDRDYCDQLVKDFFNKMVKLGGQLGVTLPGMPKYFHKPNGNNDIIGYFSAWAAPGSQKPDFVLSVLPDNGAEDVHALIKYQELMSGIQTQNIRLGTVRRIVEPRGDNICVNVLCKTNLKLGGVDNELVITDKDLCSKWFRKGVMICGMDVSHPPPQSPFERRLKVPASEPSVVALVANTGKNIFDYTGEHWFVSPTAENQVEGLDVQMVEMCSRYFETHKTMPTSVIFFRDGVSEGQFAHVIDSEVPLIRKGLLELAFKISPDRAKAYKPKLTVIVVRKRHNERLFPQNLQPGDRRRAPEQNIQPGTVVDTGITHPNDWEFYLNSHIALQGTAKPVKYSPIVEENGFGNDDIQAMCHNLCYGHQIISKAVSLPVPVFAAHDMAKRGKMLFKHWQRSSNQDDEHSESSVGAEMDFAMLSQKLSVASQKAFRHKKHFA